MTDQEAKALALLVGGTVVRNRVYVPRPETGVEDPCAGCSCAKKGIANNAVCGKLPCSGVIWIEVKS